MQAIAKVNRVYPGKEGGLIVDYMGVGAELKKALMNYTESDGKGKPKFIQTDGGVFYPKPFRKYILAPWRKLWGYKK